MNKNIYLFLCGVSLISTLGVSYYAFTKEITPEPLVTPEKNITEAATSTLKEYTTKTNAVFSVEETHPNGMSLSTITVTGKNFKEESTVTFEKDTLKNTFVNDIDNDGFSELYLVTQSAGSGSYGELIAIISNQDISFSTIGVPALLPEETATGSPFEGYNGHDSYKIENGLLIRSFPADSGTSSDNTKTKTLQRITYKLIKDDEAFAFLVTNETATGTTQVATTSIATSTPKITPSGKITTGTTTSTTTNSFPVATSTQKASTTKKR